MVPDLAGQVIEIVKLDWGLHLWTSDDWEVLLSEPVEVAVTGSATPVEVDVEPGPVPALLDDLEGATIARSSISPAGDLSVELADRQLTVRASRRYEAWQIGGRGGELFICSPGGEVTHFPPLRRQQADE